MPSLGPRPSNERSYRFRPLPLRPRPGEAETFELRLREALRSAHALGVRLRVTWETGDDGGWSAQPEALGARRWFVRGLLAVYPSGQFVPGPGPSLEGAARLEGLPVAPASRPFRAGALPPWSDAAGVSLRALPAGHGLVWDLRPTGPSPALAELPEARPLRPGERLAPPPPPAAPVRALQDLDALRRLQPGWSVRATVHPRPRSPLADGGDLARLMEGLSRRDGANGLAFAPPRPRWLLGPRRFDLALDEVLGLFPTPWSRWAAPEPPFAGHGPRLLLGRNGAGRPVEIPLDGQNGRHLVVLGETGMGKSTLLVELLLRAARLGSVVLLDPLGETAEAFLDRLPEASEARAVWVSPTRSPVAANALASLEGERALEGRAAEEVVEALRRVRAARFGETPFWGPRVEEVAHWALLVAAALPGGTLRDAERLLDGELDPSHAALPVRARAALAALRERQARNVEETEGARRLLAEANRSEAVRRLLSEGHARWSFGDALSPGTVTVLSGEAGRIGATAARLLLSVQLALLWSAVRARSLRHPVFLALDEAPWFVNESLGEMLRLGRRWNLSVLVATQSLDAFPEDLREALWTNASDFVVFRGSSDEARSFERWNPEASPERLARLARGEAAVFLGKGNRLEWIRLRPLEPPARAGTRDRVVERCRRLWGPGGPLAPADADATPRVPPGPTDLPMAARPAYGALLELRRRNGGSGPLVLRLASLREEFLLDGGALRELGRWLAARGRLRTERGPDGTWWRIELGEEATGENLP